MLFHALPAESSAGSVDQFVCRPDRATGFPVAATVPGVCSTGSDSSLLMVQSMEDGLLMLDSYTMPSDFGSRHPDGTYLLHLYDRTTQLIFCPRALVDAASGTPRADCLIDLETMAAGPGAHVGSGRMQASVIFDETGAAQCPSSLHVVGSVTGPEGAAFAIRSSLVLSPTGSFRSGPEAGWQACSASLQELDLTPASPEAGPARFAELDQGEWSLVDELVRMNDTEWNLLRQLLRLSGDDVERLVALVRGEGAAAILPDGRVASTRDIKDGQTGTVVTLGPLEEILTIVTDIQGTVNTINAKVNTLTTKVNNVKQVVDLTDTRVVNLQGVTGQIQGAIETRIPDRPDIRLLLEELQNPAGPSSPLGDPTVVEKIGMLIGNTRALLDGVLATTEELRLGFGTWESGPCGDPSLCSFRVDLAALFDDIGDAAEFGQSLSCLDRPGLAIQPLDTAFVETLIIDKAPPVLLFALSKFLDALAQSTPGSGGWQALISDVLAEIPQQTRADLAGLCTEESAAVRAVGSGGAVCGVLRRPAVGAALQGLKGITNYLTFRVAILAKFMPDEVVVQATGVAGGGGGAGTSVVYPAKAITEAIEVTLERVLADRALALREQCLAADAAIEADLRACSPPVSVLVDDNEWTGVGDVVRLRIEDVEDCQDDDPPGCRKLCCNRAYELWKNNVVGDPEANIVTYKKPKPVNYRYFCDAYLALSGRDCEYQPNNNGCQVPCNQLCPDI